MLKRLRHLLRHRQADAELAEEIEFHRMLRERQLQQDGLSAEEAVLAARRALGNSTLAREDARAVWIAPWLESIWQDLAYGARTLRRQPGFTLTALVALALAIGLNTSLFTVYNAVAFRPWPVPAPGRVVTVYNLMEHSVGGNPVSGFSVVQYRDLQDNARSFQGLIAWGHEGVRLGDEPAGKRTRCLLVSGNYFDVLGVPMELGRGFLPSEDRLDAPQPVAVLTHAAWRGRFGADPEILGRRIRIANTAFTIVGVASRDFTSTSPDPNDLFIPFAAWPLVRPGEAWVSGLLRSPDNCCVSVAGRLAPGVSRDQARAELEVLNLRFRSRHDKRTRGILLAGTPFFANPVAKRKIGPAFMLMFVGVTLVLLLACANVGNLLLARAAARQREIAIRLSIGAGRSRVVRQLLTEALLLAGAAAGVGLALAYWLPGLVLGIAVEEAPNLRLTPDLNVLAYAAGVAVFSCLAFALAPALRSTRWAAPRALGRQEVPAPGGLSLRSVLLGSQVAISVVLLVAAMLLLRGVQRAAAHDPGFAIGEVSTASVELPASYDGDRTRALARRLTAEVEALPEARVLGLTMIPPLSNRRSSAGFVLPGGDRNYPNVALFHRVSSGYFDVLRIPILEGRNFTPADRERKVTLVNQAMARRYWPDGPAVGKAILLGSPPVAFEVVGIVRDVFTTDLDRVEPTFYLPFPDDSVPDLLFSNTEVGMAARVEAILKELEPQAVLRLTPLSENLERSLAPARVGAALAGALGALALALAAIGTSGVFAYYVRQRTKEIGIRMALGARPAQATRVVLGSGSRALLGGLTLGVLASVALSSLIESKLYGLSRLDPVSYGLVGLLLGAAALAASYFPARRAARIDPMSALRHD